jgi:hypothetical protein
VDVASLRPYFRRNLRLPKTSFYKKIGPKFGIIASFILIPFLFSYAQNNEKVDENGAVPVSESNRQSVSSAIDTSRDVKQIQTLLALLKFNPGPIDGIIGQKTEKAIRAFQLDIGVPVTGIIDENLKSQLDSAYKSVVIRNQDKPEENKEKPEENKEQLKESALPDTKLFSEPELQKEQEMNRPKELEIAQQKDLEQKDRNLKSGNQYLKFIKIGLPIAVLIFLAYFYRRWTRMYAKRREEKKPEKENPIEEKSESARPEEELEELIETQEVEKEITVSGNDKPKLYMQDQNDFQDPSHPRYISPVVRRKVWIRNKGQCAMCGSRKDLQYDYITPIPEGGNNVIDNLQLLCKKCDNAKADK